MRAFRDLPVRWKLMLVILGTSAMLVLLAGFALTAFESFNFRQNLLIRAHTLAQITADNAAPALMFGRVDEANRILSLLGGRPEIVFAGFYTRDGALFAQTGQRTNDVPARIDLATLEDHHFEKRELVVTVPVRQDNETVGAFCLRMDFRGQHARFNAYLVVAGLTLAGLLSLALFLAARLQRYFSDPILQLADAAERVKQQHDYSMRANKFSNDEVGSLVDSFNQMLSEIQQRDVALRTSEEKLKLALNASGLGVWDWNVDGNLVTWSSECYGIFGVDRFAGTVEAFIELVHPEDRLRLKQAIDAAQATRTPYATEFRVVGSDGTIRWLADQGLTHYDEQGRPSRMIGTVLDITERKRTEAQIRRLNETLEQRVLERTTELEAANRALRASEARFRSYFDLPLIGIAITSLDKAFMETNAELCQILGYRREQLRTMTWSQLSHPDDLAADTAEFKHVLAGESEGYAMEKRFLRGDGEVIHAAVALRCVRKPDGAVDYFVVLVQDITARKRAEQERAQLFRQLEVVNNRLELLSRRLIEVQETERRALSRELHDQIGQALTAIQMNLQRTVAVTPASAQRTELEASLQLLEELLQQTQDLSLSLRPSLLDDLGLDSALQWLTDRQTARAGLRGEYHPASLEERLEAAIETACFRVAQEAITNVLRHAHATELVVSLRREDSKLRLSIHDDGVGFDAKARSQSSERYKDLGLLGMEERAVQVGGRLEIESEADAGTTVIAWFPLRWRAAEPDDDGV